MAQPWKSVVWAPENQRAASGLKPPRDWMTMRYLRDCLIALALLSISAAATAARTDTVLLVNGNAITGEIEHYEFGDLEYGTDSMGTVNIDWEDVVGITSNQSLQVEVVDGTKYFGSLEAAEERFHINVITAAGPVELSMRRIVRMEPIATSKSFIKRLEGNFSLGFNSQAGSDVTTFNTTLDLRYRTLKYLVGVNLNSSITDQPSEETQERHTVGVNYQRFRPERWYTDWFGNWEQNDQLGIKHRFSLGGGLGRYMIQTNKNHVSLMAGLQATREEFVGQDPGDTIAEGRLQFRWLHRNVSPDARVTFTAEAYPLLKDLSEYRAEGSLVWTREFFSDLDFMIDLYYSYQSSAPSEGERTDHGIITSLAYSFN